MNRKARYGKKSVMEKFIAFALSVIILLSQAQTAFAVSPELAVETDLLTGTMYDEPILENSLDNDTAEIIEDENLADSNEEAQDEAESLGDASEESSLSNQVKVHFETFLSDITVDDIEIERGTFIEEPSIVREGYEMEGWFLYIDEKDISQYAKIIDDQDEILTEDNIFFEEEEKIIVEDNDLFEKEHVEQYDFSSKGYVKWDFERYAVLTDIELYASWKEQEFDDENEIHDYIDQFFEEDSSIDESDMDITTEYLEETVVEYSIQSEESTSEDPASENPWGDIDETVKNEVAISTTDEIPQGLWISGVQDMDYTGSPITFPNIRVYSHNTCLVPGTDYTIKYSSNINVGDAQITVTGKGNYAGTISKTFKIRPLDLSASFGGVKRLHAPSVYFPSSNGTKLRKGTTTVSYNIGTKENPQYVQLKKDKDYYYVYEKNYGEELDFKSDGLYYVAIYGKGNYTGKAYFQEFIGYPYIPISSLKVNLGKFEVNPKKTEVRPEVFAYDGEYRLQNNLDVTITYLNNNRPGTASVVISERESRYAGNRIVNFTIPALPLNTARVELTEEYQSTKEYTGSKIEQNGYKLFMTIGQEEVLLVEGRDYVTSYTSNIVAGKKATIVFTGINWFTGSIKKTFTIDKKSLDDTDIHLKLGDGSNSYKAPFQKGGSKPRIEISHITDGQTTILKEGKDYSLKYKNNTGVYESGQEGNTPTVTIIGKGNYRGEISRNFEIQKESLENLTAVANDFVYSGKPGFKYVFSITDSRGSKLAVSKDYIIEGFVNEKGEALDPKTTLLEIGDRVIIKVSGIGNFEGTREIEYGCVKGDLSKSNVKIAGIYPYTGRKISVNKSDITVTLGGKKLKESDYDIVGYENNIQKGKAKVILAGIGNYGGKKTATFNITAKSMMHTITFDNNDAYMTQSKPYAVNATGIMKQSRTAAGGKLPTAAFKRTSYKFIGWAFSPSAEVPDIVDKGKFYPDSTMKIATYSTEVTLYAIWEPVGYKITYVGAIVGKDGVTENTNPLNYTVDSEMSLTEPLRTGYSFEGFYLDSNYSKPADTTIKKGDTGNKIFYVKWSPIKYSITYHLEEGMNSADNPDTYTVESTIPLKNASKDGFLFDGWYADDTFSKEIKSIPKGTSGSIDLYAKWIRGKYSIQFDVNKAYFDSKIENLFSSYVYGKMEDMNNLVIGEKIMLPKNSYSYSSILNSNYKYERWIFDSWNTKQDGSGESFEDASEIVLSGILHGETVKLYAQWREKRTYQVIYHLPQGGTHTNKEEYDDLTNKFSIAPAKMDDVDFIGWYDNPNYEGESFQYKTFQTKEYGDMEFWGKFVTLDYDYKVGFINQPYNSDRIHMKNAIYIKTDNPGDKKPYTIYYERTDDKQFFRRIFKDSVHNVEVKGQTQDALLVEGGALQFVDFDLSGEYKLYVKEYSDDTRYYSAKKEIGTIHVKDIMEAFDQWQYDVIAEFTTEEMNINEKMIAISNGLYNKSKYLKGYFDPAHLSHNSSPLFLYLLEDYGVPFFELYEWDSSTSPWFLVEFGKKIGYPLVNMYSEYPVGSLEWNQYHSYARGVFEGMTYYYGCYHEATNNLTYEEFLALPKITNYDEYIGRFIE